MGFNFNVAQEAKKEVAEQLKLNLRGATVNFESNISNRVIAQKGKKTLKLQVRGARPKQAPFIVAKGSYNTLNESLESQIKLPHIFVLFPPGTKQFFVVPSPEEVRELTKDRFLNWWGNRARKKNPNAVHVLALTVEDVKYYKDRWDLLDC